MARSTDFAHSGSYSLKLTTPATIYKKACANKSFEFTDQLHILDFWFYLPSGQEDAAIEFSIEGWSGAQSHLSSIEWKNDSAYTLLGWQRWSACINANCTAQYVPCQCCSGANAGTCTGSHWRWLPGGKDIDLSEDTWHHIHSEVNYSTNEYVRVIIDDTIYDLSGLPYPVAASSTNPSANFGLLLWTETANAVSGYVDDITIEKANP